jgi:RNA polymerase sigma-70 factor, ECF subfamily
MLQRLRDQEPEAWARLVDVYSPLVRRWCRRWGFRSEDVRDLAQETFLAASGSLDQFRRDRQGDSFRGWLFGVARNVCRNHWRKNVGQDPAPGGTDAYRRILELPDTDPDLADDDDELRAGDRVELFTRALELLRGEFSEGNWRMFWRTAVEGHEPSDIAADFGVSPAAVRKAKSRVLHRLREEIGELIST